MSTVNAFGQAGGFENLIVRLSPPPAREETLPAPLAAAPLPPAPLSTLPTASVAAAVDAESPGVPAVAVSPPLPPGDGSGSSGGAVSSVTAVAVAMTVIEAGVGVGVGVGGEKPPSPPAAVPLEAVRNALAAVASVRPLLARRVARAILDRTATAVSAALKE